MEDAEMTTKERKQLEVLRNYIEKAIWKSMEIQTDNWKIEKVNAELTRLIDLIDEVMEK
jgi:hypothetical protein